MIIELWFLGNSNGSGRLAVTGEVHPGAVENLLHFSIFLESIFTHRFGRTRCWRVALECLLLFHRLLRSVPEESSFRSELLWARSNGLITLYPCHFRDDSSYSASEEYTAFIRSYALLLDEALDCFALDSRRQKITKKTKNKKYCPVLLYVRRRRKSDDCLKFCHSSRASSIA